MKHKFLIAARASFWVIFLVSAGYIALHPTEVRYGLRDWWRLRSYSAPAPVSELAEQIRLTDSARKTFYASYPELRDKQTFSSLCEFPEQTFVIGCYDGDRIYLLDVEEEELESVEPVTAAHELLHAIWGRHSSSEQDSLTKQLRQVFDTSTDEELRKLIEKYRAAGSDRDTINNELHSILATEVHQLTPELERYYGQYFTDRAAIVKLYDSYKAIFARNQAEVDSKKEQLDRLQASLTSVQDELTTRKPAIDAANAQLDAYAAAGDAANYNRLLAVQRTQINTYNQLVRRYNADVAQYRRLAAELTKLSIRHNELVDAIDSSAVRAIEED